MTTYTPAEVFAPGEYLQDELEVRGWTAGDFTEILGWSAQAMAERLFGCVKDRMIGPAARTALTHQTESAPDHEVGTSDSYKQDEEQTMASMYPDRILNPATPDSERKVFDAFRTLGDDWLVFHSVAWQGKRGRRQSDGEADFVIVHPKRGGLVVEVKGGGVSLNDGQWTTTDRYGDTHRINPFQQVRDSKHFLGEYLAEHIPGAGAKVYLGHCVVFPDVEIAGDLSPEAQREVVIDRTDLSNIGRAVHRVANHWDDLSQLDDQQMSALRQALAPTHQVKRLLRHEVEDRLEELIQLTDQQIQVLQLLRRQRRALITGGAGTGKTVLAVERARQLALDGNQVLLLSYNAPLGDRLREDLADVPGVTAGNFHKVARSIVAQADMLPSDTSSVSFFRDTLPELLPDAAEATGTQFDAVVVDEGQDFHANWWTALQFLLADPDDGFMYVFADANQNLYQSDWEPPFEGEPFELDINCRNTLPIGERVAAVFGRDEPNRGTDGPAPRFIKYSTEAQLANALDNSLRSLLQTGGIHAHQITVLTPDRHIVDKLRGRTIEGHPLVEAGQPGIVIETVQRFKGLENDAVIVVLNELESRYQRALAYVGMSRARVLLTVIGPPSARTALDWD